MAALGFVGVRSGRNSGSSSSAFPSRYVEYVTDDLAAYRKAYQEFLEEGDVKGLKQFKHEAWSQAPPEIFMDLKRKILHLLIIKYFSELNTSAEEIKALILNPAQLKENLLAYIKVDELLTQHYADDNKKDLDELLKDEENDYKFFNSIFYITFDGFIMRDMSVEPIDLDKVDPSDKERAIKNKDSQFNGFDQQAPGLVHVFPYSASIATFLPKTSKYYDYYKEVYYKKITNEDSFLPGKRGKDYYHFLRQTYYGPDGTSGPQVLTDLFNYKYPVAFAPYLGKDHISFNVDFGYELNRTLHFQDENYRVRKELSTYSIVYLNAVKNCGKLPTKNNNFIKRRLDFINQTKGLLNTEGELEKALTYIKEKKAEIDDIIGEHLTIFNDPKKKGKDRSKASCDPNVRAKRVLEEGKKYQNILDIIAGEGVPVLVPEVANVEAEAANEAAELANANAVEEAHEAVEANANEVPVGANAVAPVAQDTGYFDVKEKESDYMNVAEESTEEENPSTGGRYYRRKRKTLRKRKRKTLRKRKMLRKRKTLRKK
jgi:hypothetical protein